MKIKNKQSGLTLVELLVVLGIIAAVIAISLPAINTMQKSFDSTGAEGMISAALSTARTLAISKQQYVGVRFQLAGLVDSNIMSADQYMIFVINDRDVSNVDEMFRAIEGYKPMKLPANIGVIDKMVRTDNAEGQFGPMSSNANERGLRLSDLDAAILERTIADTDAFSIVFSPAGKLVISDIRTRNKAGKFQPTSPDLSGNDHVFNSFENIKNNETGQFIQDDYANFGLGGEKSRKIFYIYDRAKLRQITNQTDRWNYISSITASCINPHTGGIIDKN
jgi:prepilin-type N-terminal cleavage/methylation domain-containing protein